MNNKGQVLVVFLLSLPLILFIFALIIDNGYTYIYKRKIENEVKQAIKYRFETTDDTNLISTKIKGNIDKYDSSNKIFITQNYISINLEYERKNIFDFILNKSSTKIAIRYIGTMENSELIIRKD